MLNTPEKRAEVAKIVLDGDYRCGTCPHCKPLGGRTWSPLSRELEKTSFPWCRRRERTVDRADRACISHPEALRQWLDDRAEISPGPIAIPQPAGLEAADRAARKVPLAGLILDPRRGLISPADAYADLVKQPPAPGRGRAAKRHARTGAGALLPSNT